MPLFTDMIVYFQMHAPGFAGRLFVGLLIFIAAVIGGKIVARATERVLAQRRETVTLAPVLGSLAKVLIIGAGAITALAQVGIDVRTVLAGAGVLGLAVGFGAQTLVKDLLSGFFLIFDDVLHVGDSVKMDAVEGVVEEVGLRMTRVRAFNGRVWYVPNGSITVVGNSSRGWARAIVEVGISYRSDVGQVLQLLRQIAEAYSQERPGVVLEAPEAQGVLSLDDSSIKVRLVLKVLVSEQFPVEIELRRRVKEEFERKGIDIPFPTRTLLHQGESQPAAQGAR